MRALLQDILDYVHQFTEEVALDAGTDPAAGHPADLVVERLGTEAAATERNLHNLQLWFKDYYEQRSLQHHFMNVDEVACALAMRKLSAFCLLLMSASKTG